MKLFSALLLLLLFSCTTENKITNVVNCSNPLIDSVSTVNVYSTIDGDTFKFKLKDDIFSVRILDLDCFETKINDRLKEQAIKKNISNDSALKLGLRAKYISDSLLSGKTVKIVRNFKEDNFDVYNRILRHVFINDTMNYTSYFNSLGLNVND